MSESKVYPGAGDIKPIAVDKFSLGPAPKKHDPVDQPSSLAEGGSGEIVSK